MIDNNKKIIYASIRWVVFAALILIPIFTNAFTTDQVCVYTQSLGGYICYIFGVFGWGASAMLILLMGHKEFEYLFKVGLFIIAPLTALYVLNNDCGFLF